jgi:signal peptidase I
MTGWRRNVGSPLRQALWVLLIGLLVFQLLRTHVAERYRVTSPSMEPTLHGDPRDGDVVLVDKSAPWRPGARPFVPLDLVVVRGRESDEDRNIVKRLIAVGPTAVALRDGDVFTRNPSTGAMERLVKRPGEYPELRLRKFAIDATVGDGLHLLRPDPATWTPGEAGILVTAVPAEELAAARSPAARESRRAQDPPDDDLPLHLSIAEEIDTAFESVNGRLAVRRGWPRDIGLEVEVVLPDAGIDELHLVVEHLEVYYALRYRVSGALEFEVGGLPGDSASPAPPLPAGIPVRLAFGYLDGAFFATLDGEEVFRREYDLPVRAGSGLTLPGSRRAGPRKNLLHFAVAGRPGASVRLTWLEAFHDVHYEPTDEVFELEEGQLFLLGDNPYDSSDSRQRPHDPYARDDLIGRPIAVLAPRSRARWL